MLGMIRKMMTLLLKTSFLVLLEQPIQATNQFTVQRYYQAGNTQFDILMHNSKI